MTGAGRAPALLYPNLFAFSYLRRGLTLQGNSRLPFAGTLVPFPDSDRERDAHPRHAPCRRKPRKLRLGQGAPSSTSFDSLSSSSSTSCCLPLVPVLPFVRIGDIATHA